LDNAEPLAPATWFLALERLAQRHTMAAGRDLEAMLRHAFHLLQLTPRHLTHLVQTNLDEAAFERLLEAEAFDSAAIGLLGSPAAFAVSVTEEGAEARVCLPSQTDPTIARSISFASALFRAWVQSLVALKARSANGVKLAIKPGI
jgi:hypothetical protein